jgi:hypothetical protein
MKSPTKCAAWLLLFLLTGCFHLPFHKKHQTQNYPLAPPLKPIETIELASIELPPALLVIPGKPIYNVRVHSHPIKQRIKHRRPANPISEEASTAMDAAGSPTPGVSAIGELSSGDPANLRQQTEDSIAAIERGLNGISRNLNESEQKIVGHIREFVKQAKAALASGDVEGAHTLTAKAQVLLTELSH